MTTLLGPRRIPFIVGILVGVIVLLVASGTTTQAQTNTAGKSNGSTQSESDAVAIATGPPIGFSVTTLQNGQTIQANVPLTIKGVYASKGSGQVWVILKDSRGRYYLQNPPVKFLSGGKWIAENIRPGKGITRVDFVYVTRAGNKTFQQMAAAGKFGAFSTLPEGSRILQSIPIRVIP